jgi:hypothetical protein
MTAHTHHARYAPCGLRTGVADGAGPRSCARSMRTTFQLRCPTFFNFFKCHVTNHVIETETQLQKKTLNNGFSARVVRGRTPGRVWENVYPIMF